MDKAGSQMASDAEMASACSVEVSGEESVVSDMELLELYFENTGKSGGEPGATVTWVEDRGVAIVTFKSPEVVRAVMEKPGGHTLRKCQLTVVACTPASPDKADTASASPQDGATVDGVSAAPELADPEVVRDVLKQLHPCSLSSIQNSNVKADGTAVRTVEVEGFSNETTDQDIQQYFENPEWGGGPVTDLKYNRQSGVAIITFHKKQDALHILYKEHILKGQRLDVAPYKPPATYKDRLLLRNLPPGATPGEIEREVERRSQAGVESVRLGQENGTCVVFFKTDIDCQSLEDILSQTPYEDFDLSVETIPVSRTLMVRDFPQTSASEDVLCGYFEGAISGGAGAVRKVKMLSDLRCALVTLQNADDAAELAKKQHHIEGIGVSVTVYLACLNYGEASKFPVQQSNPAQPPPQSSPPAPAATTVSLATPEAATTVPLARPKSATTVPLAKPEAATTVPLARPKSATTVPLARPEAKLRLCFSVRSDITKEKHDVIVNTTTPELELISGQVSKAVAAAGGQSVIDECKSKYPGGIKVGEIAITDGGMLMCHDLFHCTMPRETDPRKIQEVVRDTVMKCLAQADFRKRTSIAFPLLGTGTLSYPFPLVSHAMCGAVLDYGKQNAYTLITSVTIVLHEQTTGAKDLHKLWKSYQSKGIPVEYRSAFPFKPRLYIMADSDITNGKCDAVVNPTSSSLFLNVGKVSHDLLHAGGGKVQLECENKYPKGIRVGELAITGGGDLSYKKIFHCTLPKASATDVQQAVRGVVRKSLEEADKLQMKSIAFPALGAGTKKYPAEEVARAMCGAVIYYRQHKKSNCSLTEVFFILKNKDVAAVFQEEQKLCCRRGETVQWCTGQPSRIKLNISARSDITKSSHDVLVNSTRSSLELNVGTLSAAFLIAGGPAIQDECLSKYPKGIKSGEVAVTGGGQLMCEYIFHCSLPQRKDDTAMAQAVRSTVQNCLAKADELQMESIAFPSFGTGNLKYPKSLVTKAMFNAVLDYGKQNADTFLCEVCFILLGKGETFQKMQKKYEKQGEPAWESFKGSYSHCLYRGFLLCKANKDACWFWLYAVKSAHHFGRAEKLQCASTP